MVRVNDSLNSLLHNAFRHSLEFLTSSETLLVLAVVAGSICIGIPLAIGHFVSRVRNPEELLKEQSDFNEGHAALLAHEFDCREWLRYHGFKFVWAFRFGDTSSVVWARDGLPMRFFTIQRARGVTSFEFCTEFDDALPLNLNTVSRKVAFVLPRPPGMFIQSITHFSIEDTWRIHLDSEAFLIQKFNITSKPSTLAIRESFLKSVRIQAEYTCSLRLWHIRAIYWYGIKRFIMANRTVEQQRLPTSLRH